MRPDTANVTAIGDRADRLDGKRPVSVQEAALLRWLRAKTPDSTPSAPQPLPATRTRNSSRADEGNGKITTLRKALLAEGLDIIPDPMNRYPCPKVECAKGLRG